MTEHENQVLIENNVSVSDVELDTWLDSYHIEPLLEEDKNRIILHALIRTSCKPILFFKRVWADVALLAACAVFGLLLGSMKTDDTILLSSAQSMIFGSTSMAEVSL